MRLIAELYRPTIGFLPIGDHYTMGPEQAAKACELLAIKQVVPMHFGTFPVLTGTPERLRQLVEPHGVQVLELKPGETAS
jgi:L-ascorbate metabolism protein UlaG (beta-lactamase superfamily)